MMEKQKRLSLNVLLVNSNHRNMNACICSYFIKGLRPFYITLISKTAEAVCESISSLSITKLVIFLIE